MSLWVWCIHTGKEMECVTSHFLTMVNKGTHSISQWRPPLLWAGGADPQRLQEQGVSGR